MEESCDVCVALEARASKGSHTSHDVINDAWLLQEVLQGVAQDCLKISTLPFSVPAMIREESMEMHVRGARAWSVTVFLPSS